MLMISVFASIPGQKASAVGTACMPTTVGSSVYTICIYAPIDGATLTGDARVSATVTITGNAPGVQHMTFFLNGDYLLEDFSAPFGFLLPVNKWVDGLYTISAEALLHNGTTTNPASITVNFLTGRKAPYVNTNQFQPASGMPPAPGQPLTVVAVGDGASGDLYTSQVITLISRFNPNLFLYLGDIYERGSISEVYNWYGLYFGRFRSITNPTVGNHDYLLGNDSAYRDYWNNVPDYYSYNAGGWHFISLNSNSTKIAVDTASAQYAWLQQDLTTSNNPCTIVYYHHPYFSIGREGPKAEMADIWKLMALHGVPIVLNGHDHEYQRWMPMDGAGVVNPYGITEIIVGTGGHNMTLFSNSDIRVAASSDIEPTTYGALRLKLYANSAQLTFFNTAGVPLDNGYIPCINRAALFHNFVFLPVLFR